MAVTKRVVDDTGSYREVSIPAVMFWAGDGHDHWHVHDAEAYELIRLDNGCRVGTGPSTVLPLRQHPLPALIGGRAQLLGLRRMR